MNESLRVLFLLGALAPACVPDETSSSEDLTAAGKKLIGAYVVPSGSGPNTMVGLVLTAESASSNANRFFADLTTAATCLDCVVRVEGRYTAGKASITLTPDDAAWDDAFGKFTYKRTSKTLTLSRPGETSIKLAVADSYCTASTAESDCAAQSLPEPTCPGEIACVENACTVACNAAKTCGGFVGAICDEGSFCRQPEGNCGTDAGGECVAVGVCTQQFEPVCGCDGVTYANACKAVAKGAQVDHAGPCGG